MKGVVVGCSLKKCSPDKKWDTSCSLCVQVDAPKVGGDILASEGSFFRTFTLEGSLLPAKPKDMLNKSVVVSSNNGFVDGVYLLGGQGV